MGGMGDRVRYRQDKPWEPWVPLGILIAVVIGVAGLMVVAMGVVALTGMASYGSNK